ncbi:specifically androgen-regulated gene protein [Nerophis ophidion]|uniref:specifically androgen-regulated gene protein n=1 Tax=Nerophis ophidion TaxID=159077 RepID=UPI002ADF5853|nr:specifically androgen-regulated gene protein [Nerophis ophidion]XP_061742058.1 specifically androgen-regulated gene protein [Nerophis ophidion]
MNSTSSCDSIVSGHSAFSDGSLEHLSAEEKACLLFLEETIESLEHEDDSGLSNDEVDFLPGLASRLADLSVSMSKGKLNGLQKHNSMETLKEKFESKPIQSYLVPTPFVLASSYNSSESNGKAGLQMKEHKKTLSFSKNCGERPDVTTPATKPKDNTVKINESPLPRGPLSYDALVYLRRSASTKKTPLCPRVDHTIDLSKCPSVIPEAQNLLTISKSDRPVSEIGRFKIDPPLVAPKPKMIPSNVSRMTQNEAARATNSSYSLKNATDPKVVRLEALQKLGLLEDQQPENQSVARLRLPKYHSFVDSKANTFSKPSVNICPTRSPSFRHAQVALGTRNKELQSSAIFHKYSLSHPSQHKLGDGNEEHPPITVNPKNYPEPLQKTAPESEKQSSEAQHISPKASNSVAYTVMMVPGMGSDRKEALKKLGLLKDKHM